MSQSKATSKQLDLENAVRAALKQVIGNTTAIELATEIKERSLIQDAQSGIDVNPVAVASILQKIALEHQVINLVEKSPENDETRDVYAPYIDADSLK